MYKLLNTFEFIKAVFDTVLDMINVVHYDKPLIFNGATFQMKLITHDRVLNINCSIRLSLSRLFLRLY